MRILIVEDDQFKLKQLIDHITTIYSTSDIIGKRSYNSGLRELMNREYDLIILDMSMPTYDITPNESGGRPRAFAGRDVLSQMRRNNINTPIIVVTQFETFGNGKDRMSLDELRLQLKKSVGSRYLGAISYNPAQDGWKKGLVDLIGPLNKKIKNKARDHA